MEWRGAWSFNTCRACSSERQSSIELHPSLFFAERTDHGVFDRRKVIPDSQKEDLAMVTETTPNSVALLVLGEKVQAPVAADQKCLQGEMEGL